MIFNNPAPVHMSLHFKMFCCFPGNVKNGYGYCAKKCLKVMVIVPGNVKKLLLCRNCPVWVDLKAAA